VIRTLIAEDMHLIRGALVALIGLEDDMEVVAELERGDEIVKDAPAHTLAAGIRRIAAGERVIDPDLIAAALETGASPLTARETDVLHEAETGIATEDIAVRLSLSPATVRNYLSNAITKVGGRSRIDAIRIARDAGWL
jgi:two-component system, NarL family, response regulator DesR